MYIVSDVCLGQKYKLGYWLDGHLHGQYSGQMQAWLKQQNVYYTEECMC